MPDEPTPPSRRRSRPGAAGRRQALGLPSDDDGSPGSTGERPSAAGEAGAGGSDLRDLLARITDRDQDQDSDDVSPAQEPVSRPTGAGSLTPTVPDQPPTRSSPSPSIEATPDLDSDDGGAAVSAEGGEGESDLVLASSAHRIPTWRRALFAVTVLVLVLAIPALGFAGYRLLSNSTGGRLTARSNDPSDPGYEAQVELTPTAVVVQYDAMHKPVGATFLSLSSSDGGGAVIFVPLDIEVLIPKIGPGRLPAFYDAFADEPDKARAEFATKVSELLNVGAQDVVELNDAQWASLVAPVAPLRFDNPEPVTLPDGTVIAAGQASLGEEEVGPYLATRKTDESDVAHLARSQLVWKAWLGQVAAAGPGAVPGETSTGIGRFATALAKGTVSYNTLPVSATAAGPNVLRINKDEVGDLVTDAVPSPAPARPGSRFTVRLLNGVSADPIPRELTRDLVRSGGSVTIIGNGPKFGQDETTIVYGDRSRTGLAKLVLKALGGQGKTRYDVEAPDTVDLTIVLGKDILGKATAAPSTSPTDATTSPTDSTTSDPTNGKPVFGTAPETTEGT